MAERSNYDAIVIGGGIMGCSIGWRLAQAGWRVALLERGHVGCEASSAATGVFVPEASAETAPDLINFWVTSNAMYSDFIEETRAATGHVFEFRVPGKLVVALNDDEEEQLRTSYALQGPAGVRASWLTGREAREAEPLLSTQVHAAVFYPDHGVVDNPRLTQAIGAAFRRAGGDLFENRGATGLVVEGDAVVGVDTATGPVRAPVVVNCAGSWAGQIDSRAAVPVRPAKGQVLAVDRGALPLHHLVGGVGGSATPRADGYTIIAATFHDIGFNKDVIAGEIFGLFERTVRLLPRLAESRFLGAWAGLRPMAADRRPIVGRDPALGGLYWATGHLGMGMVSAPITAKAVSELILGGETSVDISGFGAERFERRGTYAYL